MDRVQHLRVAVTTAHRLVVAIARGARPSDPDADGAALADILDALARWASREAVNEAFDESRARLTATERSSDDMIREALTWTAELQAAQREDPRAATMLWTLARALLAARGDTADVALRDEIYARATLHESEAAQQHGDPASAREWSAALDAGLEGAVLVDPPGPSHATVLTGGRAAPVAEPATTVAEPPAVGDGRAVAAPSRSNIVQRVPAGAMFRGDAARTGDYGAAAGIPVGPQDWAYHTGAMVRSSPLVAGGLVYAGSMGGLHAVDAVTGAARWTHPTGGAVDASPAVADDTVFVTSTDGVVQALGADDGALRWAYDCGTLGGSSPAVVDGVVVVGGPASTVLALDALSGAMRWTRQTGGHLVPHDPATPPLTTPTESSPAVADGAVFINDGRLLALELASGATRWTAQISTTATTSPAIANGLVYTAELGGTVCAVDAADGTVRWRSTGADVFFAFSAVAVVGGTVVASGQGSVAGGPMGRRLDGGVVLALDAVTGTERWRHRSEGAILCSPAIVGGIVYLIEAGRDLHVLALAASSGELRQRRRLHTTGRASVFMSSPAIAGGTLYVGLPDGRLMAMPAQGTGRSGFRRRLAAWWGRDPTSAGGSPQPDLHPAPLRPTRTSARRKVELQQQADQHAAAAQEASSRGDDRGAAAASTEAVHAVDELRRAFPDDPEHAAVLAGQLYNRAAIMERVGETWQGAADARRALTLYRELAGSDPGTYTPLALDVQSRLALLLAGCGESAEARALGADAVEAHRALVARHPGHEAGLARTLARYSEAMVKTGDRNEALVAGREALRSYRRRAGGLGIEETLAFGRTAYNVAMLLLPPTAETTTEGQRAADDAVAQLTVVARAGMGDAVPGARMLAQAFRTGTDPR